jgi:hypothetical protein
MTSDLAAKTDLVADVEGGPGQEPYILAWYGCDARTGGIIEELPLKVSQALSRKLGTSTSCTADVPLAGAPAGWVEATTPGACMAVAVDTATDTPIWAGLILTRTGGSRGTASIALATPEAYLDRRYIGNIALTQQDQATVMTALMATPLTDGLCFVMDAPPTGVLMDYTAADSDDRTVLSGMQEIMGQAGGPEWTIDVAWNAQHTGFVLPVRVRPAIGLQTDQPEGTFDFPGSVSDYSLIESYEAGRGATVVIARGEGEGVSRATSGVYTAADQIAAGWPRWVYRYTPASGITDPAVLNSHAASALALMKAGSQVWTVQASASRAPRIGRDFNLGDTVRLVVDGSPRHPKRTTVIARAWSWELDVGADTLTPILVEED